MRRAKLVTSNIRRHMNRLPKGGMFTTRELLCYMLKRSSLDQALSRMVKKGEIQRLARGVFRKASRAGPPTTAEIARVKALAYKKELVTHGADAAHQLKLVPQGNVATTYATDGHSSSFLTVAGTVLMKHVCPRKLYLGDNPIGLLIRAGTFIGKHCMDWQQLNESLLRDPRFGRQEKEQLRKSAHLMPSWFSDMFCAI